MSGWERILRLIRCILLAAIASVVAPILVQLIDAAIGAASAPVSCDDLLAKIAQAFGLPCASYQAAVKAYGWFIVFAFVVILAGLLVTLVRCVISAFPHKEEEKRPTVSIQGVGPLLLYRESETTGSPILMLEGVGDPPDGTYTWFVLAGTEKIQLEGDISHRSLPMKPLQKSDSRGDVTIQLTYTTPDGTATARESLTVHTPSFATQISTRTDTSNGPIEYGYDFTVRYRILDQFGERFPEGDLFLDEDMVVLVNPYNTTFEEREYMSDSSAEYNDHYTLLFYSQPVPSDYIARVRQVVRANGVEVLDHILVWKSTHVDFE